MEQKKYNYFYKITNIKNGFYYYGIHSTDNLDDGYMGSGRRLKRAVKIFGKENFVKEILRFFDSREEASAYEEDTVNESCVNDTSCYNLKRGGDYGLCLGTILVKDKNGKFYRCKPYDKDLLNGILVPVTKGCVCAKEKSTGNQVIVTCSEFHKNRSLYETFFDNSALVKTIEGKIKRVPIDNEDYINGALIPFWKGRKHTDETKEKMSRTHKEKRDQVGEKNSQYGTCWITKDGINKKIKKSEKDKYLSNGWILGRFVNQDKLLGKYGYIDIEEFKKLVESGEKRSSICSKFNMSKTSYFRFKQKNNI